MFNNCKAIVSYQFIVEKNELRPTPIIVFEELTINSENKDELTKWILPKRKYFKGYSSIQLHYVSQIINKFPNLIESDREKDQADPWLIALAIEEQS